MREEGYESIDSSEDNKKEFYKIASHILKNSGLLPKVSSENAVDRIINSMGNLDGTNSGLLQGVEAFILLMVFE
ncbi:hypothetical protein FQT05_06860 [Enterococcus hirae]|nr:hypothetical protein [Enterococcus hirae]